jgi:hypothetical protein
VRNQDKSGLLATSNFSLGSSLLLVGQLSAWSVLAGAYTRPIWSSRGSEHSGSPRSSFRFELILSGLSALDAACPRYAGPVRLVGRVQLRGPLRNPVIVPSYGDHTRALRLVGDLQLGPCPRYAGALQTRSALSLRGLDAREKFYLYAALARHPGNIRSAAIRDGLSTAKVEK